MPMARPSRNGACPGSWPNSGLAPVTPPTTSATSLTGAAARSAGFEANQWKRPEMSDIRDLIRIYEIEGAERDEIEDLAVRCRVRPWWREYGEIFDNEFPGYENDATSHPASTCRSCCPACCRRRPTWRPSSRPGRARPPGAARRSRRGCAGRRSWTGPTGPRRSCRVVITEASLLYRWGMHGDRREQIEHLAEMSQRRNVELRIQRFDDGPPTGIYLDGQHLRLPRRRAVDRVRGDRLLHRRGQQRRRP